MAKKTRVPLPPNQPSPGGRSQFPQQRSSPPRQLPVTRGRVALAVAGLAVLIVVAGAIAVLSRDTPAAETLRQAGCRYRTFPAQKADHIPAEQKVTYNSFPPTSGPMTSEMIVWGAYDEPILGQKQLLHNLEHGGVAIQYGAKVDRQTVTRLEEFYLESPNGLVLAPLPALGKGIALTAWNADPEEPVPAGAGPGRGILASCSGFDEDAFRTFLAAHRYQGPERMGKETLEPGQ